jgi:hypothetical protein
MTFILIVVLLVFALFCKMLLFVLRNQGGKIVVWLLIAVVGSCVVSVLPSPPTVGAKLIASTWVLSLICLPPWWLYKWAKERKQEG